MRFVFSSKFPCGGEQVFLRAMLSGTTSELQSSVLYKYVSHCPTAIDITPSAISGGSWKTCVSDIIDPMFWKEIPLLGKAICLR